MDDNLLPRLVAAERERRPTMRNSRGPRPTSPRAGTRRRVQSLDRPKSGWESLTDAELQVASLAAADHTNRGSPTGCSSRPGRQAPFLGSVPVTSRQQTQAEPRRLRSLASANALSTWRKASCPEALRTQLSARRLARQGAGTHTDDGLLNPAEALKSEPDPGGQVKVQPGRPVVQVAAE